MDSSSLSFGEEVEEEEEDDDDDGEEEDDDKVEEEVEVRSSRVDSSPFALIVRSTLSPPTPTPTLSFLKAPLIPIPLIPILPIPTPITSHRTAPNERLDTRNSGRLSIIK